VLVVTRVQFPSCGVGALTPWLWGEMNEAKPRYEFRVWADGLGALHERMDRLAQATSPTARKHT